MRTTLEIADDVLQAVKERSRREGRSMGAVLSDLARLALTAHRGGPAAGRREQGGSRISAVPEPRRSCDERPHRPSSRRRRLLMRALLDVNVLIALSRPGSFAARYCNRLVQQQRAQGLGVVPDSRRTAVSASCPAPDTPAHCLSGRWSKDSPWRVRPGFTNSGRTTSACSIPPYSTPHASMGHARLPISTCWRWPRSTEAVFVTFDRLISMDAVKQATKDHLIRL